MGAVVEMSQVFGFLRGFGEVCRSHSLPLAWEATLGFMGVSGVGRDYPRAEIGMGSVEAAEIQNNISVGRARDIEERVRNRLVLPYGGQVYGSLSGGRR